MKIRLLAILALLASAVTLGAALGLYSFKPPGPDILRVDSRPTAASVFLDQKFAGVTPLTLRGLARGPHHLRFARSGYRDKGVNVTIDHREHSVRVQLDPLPPTGVVLVQSDPSGAYAWIDGEGGLTTPARFTDVAEGVHQLKVEMPGWLSQEQAIEVRSAEETSLSVKLVSRKVSYFLEAIAREPQKLSNYTELGRIYFLEGEIDKVFEMLRRGFVTLALSGHPPDKGFRELLRLATNADPDLQSERWRQFLAEMRQGIQDVHPYSLALPYAFSLLARAEQWKEVADLSTRFLERDPRARPFYVWRMQARGRLGDTQGVAQDIQRLRDLGLISAQPVLIPSARGTNVPDLGWVSAMWAAALARVQLNDLAGADELIRPFESQTNVHYWTESIRGERWLRDRRGDPPKPWLEARRCTQPPAIDGRLDDPAWTSAARGHRFYHWLTDQPSQLGSVVLALYDEANLYLAMDFEETDPLRTRSRAQPQVVEALLADAHIELFVDARRDYQTYKQFMINSVGTQVNIDCIKPQRFDPLFEGNQAWNPLYQCGVQTDEKGWRLELALPFPIFDAPAPHPGDAWCFNLVRCEGGGGQNHASFVPVYGSYHQPERFALLLFHE